MAGVSQIKPPTYSYRAEVKSAMKVLGVKHSLRTAANSILPTVEMYRTMFLSMHVAKLKMVRKYMDGQA